MRHSILLGFSTMLLGACATRTATDVRSLEGAMPQPTERAAQHDEKELSRGRKQWIERMHKTAPGVDWRAIERANGEREMARRNRLAALGQANTGVAPWSEVGSSNLAGRMWCASIASDDYTLYAGSDLGGLWRGNLDGTSWTPLGDDLYGGVYDLVTIPGEFGGDPDVVLIRGQSLRVTRDEGATWESPSGLLGITSVRGVARLLDASHTLLVLAQTNVFGNAPALYASTDYGRTFTKRYQHATSGNATFWVPRRGLAAADTIYLMVKGQCLVSTDSGASFTPLGVATANPTDNVMSGSEDGAPTLYAGQRVANQWQLWRSDDAGASWINTNHVMSDFYGTFCASAVSSSVVVYGGVEAHRSSNGGQTFSIVNPWGAYYNNPQAKLHADIFGLDVFPDPNDPIAEIWLVGTDGGLYKSFDIQGAVANLCLQGLGVSQYYSTLTSASSPSLILAGSQDQGYQRGTYVPPVGSGPSTPFSQLISGDYGHLTSTDGSHARVICTYPGFILIQEGEQSPALFSADFPSGSNHDWLPMVVADPVNANVFYFCGNQLWKYTRITASNWQVSLHSSQNFATGGSYLTAIAFAPTDPDRVYAVNDGGKIWYSTDHGVTWTPSASSAPSQHYFYGNAITVHPTNALECAIGGSGYSTAGVVRTLDGGASFAPLAVGLPATHVYALEYATDGSGDLYAGTQQAPLRWHRSTATWENIGTAGAPITLYWSVEVVGGTTVRYGSYGRGIWDYEIGPTPSWSTYGVGKVGSNGLTPFLIGSGTPSYSAANFSIDVNDAVASKPGIVMYSAGEAQIPFQGGTLWLALPVKRGPTFSTDAFGFAAVPIAIDAAMVGITRYYQAWIRDPQHPDGTGVGLSDAGVATFGF